MSIFNDIRSMIGSVAEGIISSSAEIRLIGHLLLNMIQRGFADEGEVRAIFRSSICVQLMQNAAREQGIDVGQLVPMGSGPDTTSEPDRDLQTRVGQLSELLAQALNALKIVSGCKTLGEAIEIAKKNSELIDARLRPVEQVNDSPDGGIEVDGVVLETLNAKWDATRGEFPPELAAGACVTIMEDSVTPGSPLLPVLRFGVRGCSFLTPPNTPPQSKPHAVIRVAFFNRQSDQSDRSREVAFESAPRIVFLDPSEEPTGLVVADANSLDLMAEVSWLSDWINGLHVPESDDKIRSAQIESIPSPIPDEMLVVFKIIINMMGGSRAIFSYGTSIGELRTYFMPFSGIVSVSQVVARNDAALRICEIIERIDNIEQEMNEGERVELRKLADAIGADLPPLNAEHDIDYGMLYVLARDITGNPINPSIPGFDPAPVKPEPDFDPADQTPYSPNIGETLAMEDADKSSPL